MPKLLDPDDMVGGEPDKRSVIAYVAKLRQAFADQADDVKRRIAEEEAARLATERAEARKATLALKVLDFERGVNEWSQWTNGKKDIFGKAAAATGAMAAQLLGASPDETNRWGHQPHVCRYTH